MTPASRQLRRNVLANGSGAVVAVVAPLLTLPWYLRLLGIEQWGLVGFVFLVQGLLMLIDAGASQALVRELAERIGAGRMNAAMLLRSYEPVYWGVAAAGCAIVMMIAPLLANAWLRTELSLESAQWAVQVAGALFLFQFPSLLYRSVLIASQAQVILNVISVGSTLLRHLVGLGLLWLWPKLETLLAWLIVIAITELGLRAWAAWAALGIRRTQTSWDSDLVAATLPTTAAMSGIVLLGALVSQMDRIVLSGVLTLSEFSYYVIASTIAVGVLQLIYPITQACYPRMVALKGDPIALRRFSLRLLRLFSGAALLVGAGFFALGEILLRQWLGNSETADAVHSPMGLLLIGSGLNALYNIGYLHWLVHNQSHRILLVNGFSLIGAVALVPYLATVGGVTGGAAGWVLINALGLLASAGWILPRNTSH